MRNTVQRSALLLYSAEQMYTLVNDVVAYPEFVQYCVNADVHEQTAEHLRATLSFKKAGVRIQFTTCNQLEPNRSIVMQLEDGPFNYLRGDWLFSELRDNACKVELTMKFEMRGGALARLASGLFESVADTLVDSFCRRADAVYGQ